MRVTALLHLLLPIIIAFAAAEPATAKAHLIAVFPLRSETALQPKAAAATKRLVAALSQLPGWDTRFISKQSATPGAQAAAMGAEIYIVGLYAEPDQPRVSVTSFQSANDQRINGFDFVLGDEEWPKGIAVLLPTDAQAASQVVATQTSVSGQQPSGAFSVPPDVPVVVSIDDELSSYGAAPREPISYTVVQDVIVDGHLIAKAGDEATGVVLQSQAGDSGGFFGIGYKAAGLRVNVESVTTFCGGKLALRFVRSEYRRRQGFAGSHADLEIIKGQKYVAHTRGTQAACSVLTTEAAQPIPADALSADSH